MCAGVCQGAGGGGGGGVMGLCTAMGKKLCLSLLEQACMTASTAEGRPRSSTHWSGEPLRTLCAQQNRTALLTRLGCIVYATILLVYKGLWVESSPLQPVCCWITPVDE